MVSCCCYPWWLRLHPTRVQFDFEFRKVATNKSLWNCFHSREEKWPFVLPYLAFLCCWPCVHLWALKVLLSPNTLLHKELNIPNPNTNPFMGSWDAADQISQVRVVRILSTFCPHFVPMSAKWLWNIYDVTTLVCIQCSDISFHFYPLKSASKWLCCSCIYFARG